MKRDLILRLDGVDDIQFDKETGKLYIITPERNSGWAASMPLISERTEDGYGGYYYYAIEAVVAASGTPHLRLRYDTGQKDVLIPCKEMFWAK